MGRYVVRRLIYSLVTLVGLSVVVFFVTHVYGDPARLMLPLDATEAQYLALREEFGLDRPLTIQFLDFASHALRGDFGDSLWQEVPALPIVLTRIPRTLYLAASTVLFSLILALPMGAVAAIKPRSLANRLTTIFSMLGVSMPTFWLALLLIMLFAVRLGWFKTSGFGGIQYLALPVLALSAQSMGRIAEMVRSSMTEQLGSAYIVTARSKGLGETVIVYRHMLRNAAIPIITVAADELANLISGAVVIEVIFGWPGVGQLIVTAIERRDFPLIQATVLVVAGGVVALNLIVDLLYAFIDPRIRYV